MHLWVKSEEQGLEPVLMLEAEAEVEMRRVAAHGGWLARFAAKGGWRSYRSRDLSDYSRPRASGH